jgi:hypothetical protein
MQLVNQTVIPATLSAADDQSTAKRIGLLTAKASFRFDTSGRVELETQDPFPLLIKDEPTPLGDLPSDMQPRADELLEVILLGHAHAPRQVPVTALTAALTVGEVRREIAVFGDRVWVPGSGGQKVISRVAPFVKMPLTYQHAFGGTVTINLDRESPFDLSDNFNKYGLGFDAESIARDLGISFKAPKGYPSLPANYIRRLPNLENPKTLIARPVDAPEPTCWATVPIDVPIWMARKLKALASEPKNTPAPTKMPEQLPLAVSYRAHPDWVIPIPKAAPKVRMENLLESTRVLEFTLPGLSVVADYTINGRQGSRPMVPLTLVLLPDQGRFYIVYRLPFQFNFEPGDERGFRLRIDQTWFGGSARDAGTS